MQLLRRLSSHRSRSSRGQSLVEFGLILPILLLVTLGVVDAARVFTAHISLTNAVREAAIFAGYGTNYSMWCTDDVLITVPCPVGAAPTNKSAVPDNMTTRIFYEATGLDASAITLDPPVCDGGIAPTCDGSSTQVALTAHYSVEILTPMVGQIWGGSLDLSATTTAKILR
jgi:hypothetical protein